MSNIGLGTFIDPENHEPRGSQVCEIKRLIHSRRIGTNLWMELLNNQATGPLNQATGPPQSDAGVGIGMLIGDRDYIARK